MKKLGLLSALLLFIVGCGGSGESAPARDGKGNIDVAAYLPKVDVIKEYNIYGFRYYAKSKEFITVDDNIINIEEHRGHSKYMDVDAYITERTIIYDDMNITRDKNIQLSSIYRYVDLGEFRDNEERHTFENYYCESVMNGCTQGEVIGKKEKNYYFYCKYSSIENNITLNNKNLEGEFLKVKCESESLTTTYINNNILAFDIRKLDGEKGGHGFSSVEYYKKDFGHVYNSLNAYYLFCENGICEKGMGAPGSGGKFLIIEE